MQQLKNQEVERLRGHKSDIPTLYLGFIPRQRSVLTSPSQSAHVLYMSPFTLCLHLTSSPGIHWSFKKKKKKVEISMFCFCQIFGVSGAEFGLPNDLGYEAERRWAPRALMVMCPRACGEAVEALCRLRDLRGTQTLQVTSTLILNMMHTLASCFFLCCRIRHFNLFCRFLNSLLEHLRWFSS